MKKRLLSALLALVLAVSLSVPAFAAEYKDLNNHWAKPYMETLAKNGYLTGYDDGTIKPDKSMTNAETFTFLSRLYALSDFQKDLISADYKSAVNAAVPANLSWAYTNLETCLAAGILTSGELKSISFSDAVKKEQLAVYLVRALQLTASADSLNGTTLSFADADSISKDKVGSIAVLVSLGIVKGDDLNKFQPQSNVTRAIVATMFSRALEYTLAQGISLKIGAYEGLALAEGIVASAYDGGFELSCYDGSRLAFSISAASTVTLNGSSAVLGTSSVGNPVVVTARNGEAISVKMTSESSVRWLQGRLYSVSTGTTSYVTLQDPQTDAVTSYPVSDGASIRQDNTTTTAANLRPGSIVTLKIAGGTVTELRAANWDKTLTGTVAQVKFGTSVTLRITDASGLVNSFSVKITSLPAVKRGTTTISFDRLKTGDSVTCTIDDGILKAITISGTQTTAAGALKSITKTADGTIWVVTVGGRDASFTLDEDASAYSGTTAIPLSAVQIGDTVELSVYGNVITEVYVQSAVSAATKVTGSVLKIDSAARELTILTAADKLVTINASSVNSIISGITGGSLGFSSIPINSVLVAYGSFTDSRTFKAKSLIIES